MSIDANTADTEIFEFERDFAGSLRCIPMIVRFKLDQCGVKLSLRQWSHFHSDERTELVTCPCRSINEIVAYREMLVSLIRDRAHEVARFLPVDACPEWESIDRIPERFEIYVVNLGLPLPSVDMWQTLSPLQRFALIKLTRPGHDNDNFEPAMREFGLID